jgi:myosin heavy subunit
LAILDEDCLLNNATDESFLEKLTKNPELQVPEHDRVYAQLMAQLSAVKAFVASMEEPWQKEKLRKQAKLL